MSAHATHSHFVKFSKILLIFKNGERKIVKFLKTERGMLYDTNHCSYPLKKIRSATYYDAELDTKFSSNRKEN